MGQIFAQRFMRAEHEGFESRLGAAEDARDVGVLHLLELVETDGAALFFGQGVDRAADLFEANVADHNLLDGGPAVRDMPGATEGWLVVEAFLLGETAIVAAAIGSEVGSDLV